MPKEGYISVTLPEETLKSIDAAATLQPNMSRQGFIMEMVTFYTKHHCPECGECTAKKEKHHEC
jgi:predicted RNA-binding Zn-ribbon protein involved in translation (DUF1610 family)